MRHVIIGSGAAGIAAAKKIRSLQPEDEITIIASDRKVHSRCMLHYYLSGERDSDGLRFIPEDFFEANKINLRLGMTVYKVDTEEHEVYAGDNIFEYDRLLIATGCLSVVPRIGKLRSARNVFGFRHLHDANAIKQKLDTVDKVVIIGGGLIGLDAAYALLHLGKKVTVVDMENRILPQQMEPGASIGYQRLFEKQGCAFRLGCKPVDTVDGTDGNVDGIVLDSGETLPCDIVIVAAGMRASIDFLRESGVMVDNAAIVDAHMHTTAQDVYAAGDVTVLSGIWPNAVQQGEVAGSNMAGTPAIYTDLFPFKNTANFFGLHTLSLGEIDVLPNDKILVQQDSKRYNRLVIREGRLVGALFQGDISNKGFWQYLVKNQVYVTRIDDSLWNLSYADFFTLDEKGEYFYGIRYS